ncbi:MAG: S1/P1 nuclease [Wenzhouxiangella sp.]
MSWTLFARLFSLLGLIFLLLSASPAQAWSRFGHEVAGHLAYHDLSPAARAAVADLLGEETLASVGSWADQVRSERPETAPMHFMNGPIDVLVPSEADFTVPQGNVYSAILGYSQMLVDESLPRSERVEALKFLVHFVADLHQPLHVGFLEDRGANDVPVLYRGEVINLHRYWDNEIFDKPRLRFDSREYAAVLLARFGDHERATWAEQSNPRDWVIEARRYIFSGIYPKPRSDATTADHGPIPVIDASYAAVWLPVAERQLARTGARLAWTLNQLFETGESPFADPPIPFPPPRR